MLVHDDARLLAETATDPEAFGRFYDRYEEAVLVFMLRRTRDPEVAADLTAEVFAGALAGAADFRYTGAPPAAWLFQIARNVLADSYRAARVQNDLRQRLAMRPLEIHDETVDRLEQLIAQDDGAIALRLLRHLPSEQRAAIVAHILEDRSYDELATELDCSSNVVRKRVSRALSALRREMKTGGHHV
ncbi:RNA polymerase sigma factor [Conexibacter sp. W3-3-2]|uniref:RNA polymerase sigma factor n=1 Tax=Conexibacter sp. W3-3-2 TaxID=2675227 RepID=UPI0018ABF329|nr:RNA polymerase sigma factor [Conexibacter sp. W3-3-2]